MFASWVAPLGVDGFVRDVFHRAAWAQPHTARASLSDLDWATLGEVLAATDPPPDVIVCAGGKHLPFPAPRDLDELRAYMRMGIGLAMRHTQRCHPKLRAVADSFTATFPGREVQVQVFVTPAQTHGFGWHYDAEDVFIVQTEGRKDYFFRRNTIDPTPARTAQPDFSAIRRETTPTLQCTLIAGDWLYLPSGWWHVARCVETSLSISLGVFPASPAGPEGRSRESS